MDYPIWDVAIGGGVLIGTISILHVIVSHFAVGGGILMAALETRGEARGDRAMLDLVRRGSTMLILVSTVFGAISGVGIWFVIGVVHPTATSSLIHSFVWLWAAEWAFFLLEVVTALAWASTWGKVKPATHQALIWLYAFSAYMSLVIIQGIISFMLTPGKWVETHSLVDAFFNPTYLSGLVLRTGICLFLAGGYLTLAALREKEPADRARLVRILAAVQVVGILVAYHAYRWWEGALPEAIRGLFRGASPVVAALAKTRHYLLWALAAYLAFALLALALPKLHRLPTAILALALSFVAFGTYERIREGGRKPFVIRDVMFSNGVLVSEIGDLNRNGILSKTRWATRGSRATPESTGRAVFRAECQMCHTLDGYLSIRKRVAGNDVDTLSTILTMMHDDGASLARGELMESGHVRTDKFTYSAMPPFVGTEEEEHALAEYLAGLGGTAPKVAEVRR